MTATTTASTTTMTAGIDTDGNDNDNDGESDEVLVHIVLTGASGYLGQHLLAHWITNGIPVSPRFHTNTNTEINTKIKIKITALYHRSDSFPAAVEEFCARHEKNINKNGITDVAVRSIDLTDPKQIGEFVSSSLSSSSSQSTQSAQSAPSSALVTIVVHSAALSSPGLCQKDPDRAGAVNVPAGFFEAVLAAESPATAIVALSTDQVYDGKPKAKPKSKSNQGEATAGTASFLYTESETDGLNPVNVYGRTKLDLERCLSELLQRRQKQKQQTQSSVSCFALRSSIILGPAAPIDPACAHGTFFGFCDDRGKNAQPTTFFTNEYRSVVRVDRVLDAIGGIVRRAVLAGVGGGGDNDNENDDNDNDNKNEADVGVVVYNMGGPCRVNRMDMARAVFDRFGYDKSLLLPALQTSPQSPLDISMDSSRLVDDGILDDGQGQTQGQTPTPENYLKEVVDYVFGAREN